MKINHLKAFVALAKNKNYTNTAKELYISQPALSQMIIDLEKELGIQLFEKHKRKITKLTQVGEIAFVHAKEIIKHTETLESIRHKNNIPQGTINIGLLWTYSAINIDTIIRNFEVKYPTINVTYKIGSSKELLDMLCKSELDIIFVVYNSKLPTLRLSNNIVGYFISSSPMYVIFQKDHPFALQSVVHIKNLTDKNLLMISKESTLYAEIDMLIKKYEVYPNIIGNISNPDIIMRLILQRNLIGLLSKQTLDFYKISGIEGRPLVPSVNRSIYMLCNQQTPHYATATTLIHSILQENKNISN